MTRCCPCVDEAITNPRNGTDPTDAAEAVTMAPIPLQVGQQLVFVVVPVCLACRRKQLARASGAGLIVP